MTNRKHKPEASLDISFKKDLKRLLQTNPRELAETLAADVLQGRERAKEQIERALQEIEDGARPKRGRFRL